MADLLKNRAPRAPIKDTRTELGDLLDHFNDRLIGRDGKKPGHARIMGAFKKRGMLPIDVDGRVNLTDLYWLKGQCDGARNFGALFWHIMNKKE